MALKIKRRERDGADVLVVEGNLAGEEAAEVGAAVRELLSAGKENIFVDLLGVNSLDKKGAAELVRAYQTAESRGALLNVAVLESLFERVPELEEPLRDSLPTLSYWTRCPTHGIPYENPGGTCPRCKAAMMGAASESGLKL